MVKVIVDQNRDMQAVTWNAVPEATGYMVYRATSETGKYTKLGTTTKAYYTDSKATAGKTYYYKVVAVGENCESAQSAYVKVKSK